MLMYSTMLDIANTLTQEAFIQLVIEWNQKSAHKENIIPDLHYQGERHIRLGHDEKWMDIEEYEEKNIIAIRYQKQGEDASIWNTDYIMNFDEMKMAIHLDHSYTLHSQLDVLGFSTPRFLSLLIAHGYLKDDGLLPVLRKPIKINKDTLSLLVACMNDQAQNRLPVIYISKTKKDSYAVDVKKLSSRLKGVAHVLTQESYDDTLMIRRTCPSQVAYNGGIDIYLPHGTHQHIAYREYFDEGERLFNKVSREILHYANVQAVLPLYTWSGVNNAILQEKWHHMQSEYEKAKNEVDEYLGAFDDDYAKMQKQIDELTKANLSLTLENQGLRSKLSDSQKVPVLYFGEEEEFYQGEIKEMLLDAINAQLKNVQDHSRRHDVYEDILQKNDHQHLYQKRMNTIKAVLKDYKSLNASLKQKLMDLGFEIQDDGKHYKLIYYGDERYMLVIAKTGSDVREGKNNASMICKKMF
ncbi:hypothetical protein SG0102_14270 [Intestinibaculum porci]|uniref:Uncharacterized protein n=2 Tax=Intestinibaculum porci TaxID=2487118 RepID=A0A3G9JNC0_9FIRM|nr:hypothetical protein SG0102_14270 [Intestinibaculum porci]